MIAAIALALLLSTDLAGRYEAAGATLELHVGPDGAMRGALVDGSRIAALSPITIDGNDLTAAAHYDDDSRATLTGTASSGVIRMNGKRFVRKAVERPATARERRELFAAYEQLAGAVNTKNFEAFQALRVADFATIPPEGPPRNSEFMASRGAGMLATIQPPIKTRNDILALTVRGDEAIATVRQFFSRQQPSREGVLRVVETEVTQRETWRKTKDGWKLAFVDEVRDHVRREP